MAKATKTVSDSTLAEVPKATKVRRFEAPKELDERFGVLTQQEEHISGLVRTEDVRGLLDAFGLVERTEVVFPFQHMKKQHGEIWNMRIEPMASHSIDGSPTMAHAWTFQQQFPERVGSA